MTNFWYLFAAYTLVWVGLFVYIFSLAGREKALSAEIEELKATLAGMAQPGERQKETEGNG